MISSRGHSCVMMAGASMLALLSGGAGAAQERAPGGAAQDLVTVEEVVVTATGREARLQDVAAPVTALTAETARNAGVTDLRAVQQIAPSFRFNSGQSNAAGSVASIRGIGTGGDNAGFESAVGFFIDGVYRNRSGVALSELPEIERIEVLRGPQGTLFGRNTTAGAISVVTKSPDFETGGFVAATAGSLNARGVSFGLTGPLVEDQLAGRLDVGLQRRDGYIEDVAQDRRVNDRDRWNARGQLLWTPRDAISLRIIADTSHTDEQCCSAVTSKQGATAAIVTAIASASGGTGVLAADPEARETTLTEGRDVAEQVDEWGLSGELNWDLGTVKLTSITAYRDWRVTRNQDVDFSDMDRAYRDGYEDHFKTFTQELRVGGEVGRLNWLAGGFVADEKLSHIDRIRFGADAAAYVDYVAYGSTGGQVFGTLGSSVPNFFKTTLTSALASQLTSTYGSATATAIASNAASAFASALSAAAPTEGSGQTADRFATHTRSASLFTHNEYEFTDRLRLTLGARFNHERKAMTASLDATANACDVLASSTLYGGVATGAQLTAALKAAGAGTLLTLICNPVVNTIADGDYAMTTSENEWSGTSSLSYKINDDVMVYGGYSRGYKAGGFNLDRSGFLIEPGQTTKPSADDLHFNPESADAFELGVKSTLLNGRATLNINAFHELIGDYQLNAFSGYNFITQNVSRVISKGVEVDSVVRPTPALTIQTGLLYNKAYFDSSVTFGDETLTSGTRLANAPVWTLTSAITFKKPIPNTSLTGLFFVDGRWNSAYRTQTLSRDPSGSTDNDAFAVFNARVGLSGPDQTWAVEAYVRNLTDQFYVLGGFKAPEQDTYAVFPSEPRTYGVQLKLRF